MHRFLKITAILLACVTFLQLFSCVVPKPDSGSLYAFCDDLGREVSLGERPSRVAVLFSSYAEIWQIAGGEVAVTVADTVERGFADDAAVIVDGGAGHTTLNTELLLASAPDFVIGTADYPVQVEACELLAAKGIPTALFRVECFDDYLSVLKIFTDILGTPEKYDEHGLAVKAEIASYLSKVAAYLENTGNDTEKMLFIRAGSSPRSTKAKKASDNFACAMLEELGLYNIANSAPVLLDGLSVEEVVMADPSRIFVSMMGESEDAVRKNVNEIFSGDGYSTLDAVVAGRVEFLPKSLFHYKPNHRWAEAYRYLIETVYPEVEL